MENDKFQEFMADQFAKMFKEFQKVKDDVQGVKDIQLRVENNLNAKVLHEFVQTQMGTNKDVVERLDRIEAKVEVLQLETAHIRRVK